MALKRTKEGSQDSLSQSPKTAPFDPQQQPNWKLDVKVNRGDNKPMGEAEQEAAQELMDKVNEAIQSFMEEKGWFTPS